MIRSHVYLARCMLKRFSVRDDNNHLMVAYYDFDDKKIKYDSITSFNRVEGYYSDINEAKLKRFSEEKIGNVIKNLKNNFNNYGLNFKLSAKDKKIIKKYISYQLIRDDSIMKMIKSYMNNGNINSNFLSNNKKIELIMRRKMLSSMELQSLKNYFISYEEPLRMFFSSVCDLGIVISFNTTEKKYVLTSSSSALFPYDPGYFMMNFTLTPEISITLCNLNTMKNILSIDDDFILTEVKDEKVVLDYNKELYKVAKKNMPNILVGFEKELKELINR